MAYLAPARAAVRAGVEARADQLLGNTHMFVHHFEFLHSLFYTQANIICQQL